LVGEGGGVGESPLLTCEKRNPIGK